jgi:hypothetical protein
LLVKFWQSYKASPFAIMRLYLAISRHIVVSAALVICCGPNIRLNPMDRIFVSAVAMSDLQVDSLVAPVA